MNDFISTHSRREFVLEQLSRYAGETKKLSGSTLVICPFHAEKTPSGRIFHGETTRSPGTFKCYGCGQPATWNVLAPLLGLKPFKREKPSDEYANLSLIPVDEPKFDEDFVAEEMEFSELPTGKTWREIKTSLLIDLGAKKCKVNHPEHGWLKTKIYLPVFINKELRGYIKARLTKHADYPSYINAKGPWSKTHGLFPFDYAIKLAKKLRKRTIVLVEGPRDALRLLQAGIPAMCILGTQSWSPTKSKLLELAGITRVLLMMDGDDAGIAATSMVRESLSQMFKVTTIKLWSLPGSPYIQFKEEESPSKAAKAADVGLWDPGNCPVEILDNIKQRYF